MENYTFTIEIHHNGILIYDIKGDEFIERFYVGYTKEQAIKEWLKYYNDYKTKN